jgi:hypothetical protein
MSEKKQISTALVATLSSLFGICIGGILQYVFTLQIERRKLWSDLRTQSYVAYIENTTKALTLEDSGKQQEARALRDSARFSIGTYGSKSVVEIMSRYAPLSVGGTESSDAEKAAADSASLELFNAMRNELVPDAEKVSARQLYPIFFPNKARQSVAK